MSDTHESHGGGIRAAARRWGIPPHQWLDLSTGINPLPWPIPEIPAELWHRLPEEDGLSDQLGSWLQAPSHARCLPVPGTQAAIQALPLLRAPCRVAVPSPGYFEHGLCWERGGHEVTYYAPGTLEQLDPETIDVLVCIQPNNPTGQLESPHSLRQWARQLQRRGGWLIVDEAFLWPGHASSMLPDCAQIGVLVLNSLGKFFGLAGARAGVVTGDGDLVRRLAEQLGPWSVPGPTRFLMAQAVADRPWQQRMQRQLHERAQRLDALLRDHGFSPQGDSPLFRYCPCDRATEYRDGLARSGILVRLFEQPRALRFGLPGAEGDWQRLTRALELTNP